MVRSILIRPTGACMAFGSGDIYIAKAPVPVLHVSPHSPSRRQSIGLTPWSNKMKSNHLGYYHFLLIASLWIALGCAETPKCVTYYGPSTVKSAHSVTRTAIVTDALYDREFVNVTRTITYYKATSTTTKTQTHTFTHTTTSGATRVTVPTHPGFIPLADAASITNPTSPFPFAPSPTSKSKCLIVEGQPGRSDRRDGAAVLSADPQMLSLRLMIRWITQPWFTAL